MTSVPPSDLVALPKQGDEVELRANRQVTGEYINGLIAGVGLVVLFIIGQKVIRKWRST